MKKVLIAFLCLSMCFAFVACNGNNESDKTDKVESTATKKDTIVLSDGTEYTFAGIEDSVWCPGKKEFLEHIEGEIETFVHLDSTIKTGMYSVDGSKDVLIRYYPYNEFASVYVKSELLKTEVALENCVRFKFAKASYGSDGQTNISNTGITECEQFLDEIKNGQIALAAGLYNFVRQPDGMFKNYYVYGHVYGVLQENLNLVIPLTVMSFDDKAYSITIDDVEYVLPQEWLDKLMAE